MPPATPPGQRARRRARPNTKPEPAPRPDILALAVVAARRRADVLAFCDRGIPSRLIAEQLGISLSRIHQMLTLAREDAQIVALHGAGCSLQVIAYALRVRPTRVLAVRQALVPAT